MLPAAKRGTNQIFQIIASSSLQWLYMFVSLAACHYLLVLARPEVAVFTGVVAFAWLYRLPSNPQLYSLHNGQLWRCERGHWRCLGKIHALQLGAFWTKIATQRGTYTWWWDQLPPTSWRRLRRRLNTGVY
ncbi:MAG: hypothetical protein ABNH02_03065 [Pseudomonadales bacterium]|jgi:hypothetical protein